MVWVLLCVKQMFRLVLVLDIDEIFFDNWLQMVQNDFGYIVNGDCSIVFGMVCGVLVWDV